MNNDLCLNEVAALIILAFMAGFGFAVGMAAFEFVCTLLWKIIYAH
ncbi:hypothetical protein RVW00_000798 [Enterobacter bugandensis]|nr:hypothetical protein [Enterobacter bugandensis]